MPELRPAHDPCFHAEAMAEARAERSWAIAWVVAASVVHGALLTWLFVVPLHGAGDGKTRDHAEATEISILENETDVTTPRDLGASLERAEIPPPPSLPEDLPARPSTAFAARGAASAAASASSASGASGSNSDPMGASRASEGAPSGSSSAAPSGGGVVPIPLTHAELGIGGRNPFLPRAEEKEPANGPNTPAARAMRGTGGAHDREIGLGPEGPAIAALSAATTSSIAPLRGRASFVVRAGGDGLVFAVDLVDSEGGSGWADAGRIALQALRGKKMRVPKGANGLAMHIEVRSEMKLPNGENGPLGVRSGENKMPEMTIPDISNLGSRPRRVVHARATGTEVL